MAKANNSEAAQVLASIVASLIPAKVCREEGIDVPKRGEVIAARLLLIDALADIRASRPCPMASFVVRMSDDSTIPFTVWARGILGVRESGKAHAVGVA